MDARTVAAIVDLRDNVLVDTCTDTPQVRAKIRATIQLVPVSILEKMLPEMRTVAQRNAQSGLVQYFVSCAEDRVFDSSLLQLADELDVPASITQPLRDINS